MQRAFLIWQLITCLEGCAGKPPVQLSKNKQVIQSILENASNQSLDELHHSVKWANEILENDRFEVLQTHSQKMNKK